LNVELGQAGKGIVVDMIVLVASDVVEVDGNGECRFEHTDGTDQICMLDRHGNFAPVALSMSDAVCTVTAQVNAALRDAVEGTES
jgi:hypothetical protein